MTIVRCKFRNCPNYSSMGKRFYRFPVRDEKRCQLWVSACDNSELLGKPFSSMANFRLCEDHFSPWCFLNENSRERLVFNAVPCCKDRPVRVPIPAVFSFIDPVESQVEVPAVAAQCEEIPEVETPGGFFLANTSARLPHIPDVATSSIEAPAVVTFCRGTSSPAAVDTCDKIMSVICVVLRAMISFRTAKRRVVS